MIELPLFSLTHSNGRGLSDEEVKASLGRHIVSATMALCTSIFSFTSPSPSPLSSGSGSGSGGGSERGPADYSLVIERARDLFCAAWVAFPANKLMLRKARPLLVTELAQIHPTPALGRLTERLSGELPADIVRAHLLGPLLQALASMNVETAQASSATASSQRGRV